jgi:polyferredoxin
MDEYKVFQEKRKFKQYLMALVFIGILVLGWYYPPLGFFIPLCMLLGIGIGVFGGRKWCDWFCPRGSFYDALIKPISPKRDMPKFLKSMPFRLAILALLLAIMAVNLLVRWPSVNKIAMFFVIMLTVTTVLGIILAFIFHPRTWCSFCPIGTLVNLVGKNKYPLKINSDLCVECKLCFKVCPIQIRPYSFKGEGTQIVRDGDCLKCNLCVMACPKDALNR